MLGLTGKTIVICGGATGIGAATAEYLAAAGAAVVVGDIDAETAEATARRAAQAGGSARAAGFDLADDDSVRALIAGAIEWRGRVDGVFNVGADLSPGTVGRDRDLLDMDADVWRRTVEVGLLGYARTCRAVIPHFLEHGGGAIVNTSSAAASIGEPTRPAYAAAKAGVNALTRHVATRWGKEGVRCNAVAPGLVLTEGVRRNLGVDAMAGALAVTRSPRLGEPADVAATVAFLLSGEAAWVNGQVWAVNGGAAYRD